MPPCAALLTALLVLGSTPAARAEEPFDVVVVGGGMGGLSTGALLSSYGMRVLLLEQHHKVGGCTSSFSRGDFRFDAALHELLGGAPGTELGEVLHAAGVDDKVELIPIPVLYRSIFPGVDFTMPSDFEGAQAALCAEWPEECPAIRAFHEEMRTVAQQTSELSDLQRHSSLYKLLVPFRQPAVVRHLRDSLGDLLDAYFQDERLKAVLGQLWIYYGPPPDRLWSVFHLSATWGYLHDRPYHVRGSSQALADAYAERIRELGGEVRTGVRVSAIEVESGRVQGVSTQGGARIPARYVVSNANPKSTFHELLDEGEVPATYLRHVDDLRPSNGLVGVYLGLDVEPSLWGIADHEIFYNTTLDANRAWTSMMDGSYDDAVLTLTFYSNLGDGFYAPPGKSVLVVHSYADIDRWPRDPKAYAAEKERVARRMLELSERVLPGLSQHIEVQEIATPRTLADFTLSPSGSPYGWEASPDQWALLPNHTPVDGLFLAGSWTSPGHGVGTVQLSGREAARQVLERERSRGLLDKASVQAILSRVPVERLRGVVQQAEALVGLGGDADSHVLLAGEPGVAAVDARSGATARYLPVRFTSHDRHVSEYGVACGTCHHALQGIASPPAACASCHDQAGSRVDLADASHQSCRSCHEQERAQDDASAAPVECLACHQERP